MKSESKKKLLNCNQKRKADLLTAVLQDLGFSFNLKFSLYLLWLGEKLKIGKAFPKPRKATKR